MNAANEATGHRTEAEQHGSCAVFHLLVKCGFRTVAPA